MSRRENDKFATAADCDAVLDGYKDANLEVIVDNVVAFGTYYRGGNRVAVRDMPVEQVDKLLEWKMGDPVIQRGLQKVEYARWARAQELARVASTRRDIGNTGNDDPPPYAEAYPASGKVQNLVVGCPTRHSLRPAETGSHVDFSSKEHSDAETVHD